MNQRLSGMAELCHCLNPILCELDEFFFGILFVRKNWLHNIDWLASIGTVVGYLCPATRGPKL